MGTNLLDADQVIKAVFDEPTQSLKTTATLVASDITIVVAIDEADDSIQVYGSDGASNRAIKTDSDGNLQVDVLSSALPSGAATEAKQDTGNTSLSSIDTKLTTTNSTLVDIENNTDGLETLITSTNTKLDTANTSLSAIDTNTDNLDVLLSTRATEATLSTLNSKFVSGTDIGDVTVNNGSGAGAVNIQDGGNSITVDGSVTANQGTSPWVVSGTITTSPDVNIHDGSGVSISSTGSSLNTNITNTVPVSGTVAATQSGTWTNTVTQATGTNLHTVLDSGVLTSITNTVHVDDNGGSLTVDNNGTFAVQAASSQSGTWNINNISGTISLPTGAATSALQTQPGVDIGDVTVNNASGASAVNIQDGGNSITVDGTGNFTVVQPTGTNLHTVVDSGTISTITNVVHIDDNGGSITVDGTVAATQSGTWNINNISGTVSLPTGAATETTLAALDNKSNGSFTLTDGQTYTIDLSSGYNSIIFQLSGHTGGSLTIEGSTDNSNFFDAWSLDYNAEDGQLVVPITANGVYTVNVVDFKYLKFTPNSIGVSTLTIRYSMSKGVGTIHAIESTIFTSTSITESVLPTDAATQTTLAAINAKLVSGTDIGDVTINNSTGASAVNIQDGGNSITVDGTIAATQSGTWTVQPGNTANTTAWKVDGSAVTQPISGTVTANAGSNLNTSLLALEAGGNLATIKTNTDNLSLAQASTTSGQKGNLILTATTTAAPTYTNAQSNPLSTTTTGALRTDASATTQPVSGTVTVTQATGTNLHSVIDSGTVAVTQATGTNLHAVLDSGTLTTVSTVTSLTQLNGAAISMNTGVRDAGTQRVTIATNDVVPISGTLTAITNVVHVDDNTGSLTVDNNGTFVVQATIAAGATNIAKAEDVGSANADVGVPAMAIRKATPANTSDADGDYEMLQMSAGRLWTSATIDAALPAGTNAIGKLSANSGVDIGDVDITSIAAGTNRLGSVRLVDSSDADLTAAKGSQTSRAVGVQNLIDAGRTNLNFYATTAAAGSTTTETAITLTKSAGTAVTSTGTSFVITNGKTFRITHLSVATRGNSTATAQTTTFNLRINTAGAVITSTTPIVFSARSATAAVASAWDRYIIPIPEGFEIAGNGTIQFGITAAATYTTNAPTWDVNIIGYEY